MTLLRIEANVVFRAYRNHDGIWTAVCDPLDLTTEGESWSDLWQNIDEMMNLMLRDLLKRGVLPKFLRARGWTMVHPRAVKTTSRVRFDIPFRVTPVEANESGQRVYS
jgi:predicted RNase H-like HicB family nuclease